MRLILQVTRDGERYHGSLTRGRDQLCVPFSGMLELMAVLERLTSDGEAEEAEEAEEADIQ